jgi:hypothetical protein
MFSFASVQKKVNPGRNGRNISNYLTLVLFQAQESFNDFLRVSFSGCLNITFSETLMQMRQLWQQI